MDDPVLPFPGAAWLALSMVGIASYSAQLGAGLSISDFGAWLRSDPDTLVTLIGSALVGGGLWLTARSLSDEAQSRRIEQYAARIREFHTVGTNAAIMMLLNYDRDIILREGENPTRCCWEKTAMALVPGYYRDYLYEPELTEIRDCFNGLLEGMRRLNFLLSQKLVREADVNNICRTLLTRLITDPMFSKESLARNLRLYIQWHDHKGVLSLCDRYRLPIRQMLEEDKAALLAELKDGRYGPWRLTGWGKLGRSEQ